MVGGNKVNIPTQRQVSYMKNSYPVGTRVKLMKMDDIQAPPIGTCGTVLYVDDMGDVGVEWDNGSCLAAVCGVDYIRRV